LQEDLTEIENRMRSGLTTASTDSMSRDGALSERIKDLARRVDALEGK
jgi:hypothetical protein